jgi:hypothetical protein
MSRFTTKERVLRIVAAGGFALLSAAGAGADPMTRLYVALAVILGLMAVMPEEQ